MASNQISNIPTIQQPFVNERGIITLPWFMLLQTLFNRTGGGSTDSPVTKEDLANGIQEAVSESVAADIMPDIMALTPDSISEMLMPQIAMEIDQKINEMVHAMLSNRDNMSEMIFATGEDAI